MNKNSIILFFISLAFSDNCNVELASSLTFDQGLSDITGFYQDGREFAVVGLIDDAAVFVDITDPFNPFEVGRIGGTPSIHRDLKYWNRHVFIGTEAGDGVKIISVDDPDNPTLINTITDFTNSHNIHIDADGYLYVVGANDHSLLVEQCPSLHNELPNQGPDPHDLWIYELTDHPANPVLVGTWIGEYFHDIEVYNNKLYGAAIYSGQFYILDVSDKSNPETLLIHHTGGVMTHDVAITYDEKYLITADETFGGHIKIWDISDYNNINIVSEYMTLPNNSVHNVYVRPGTNLLIMSYYVDGTRILDISDPGNPVEVGYFDTTDLTGLYDGNWGTYAYLPSGYIISSDRTNGLFIFESPLTNPSLEWSGCPDCAGESNGDSHIDECGICDNDPTNNCVQDCAGTWGGALENDQCGVCNGNGCFKQDCTTYPYFNFDCNGEVLSINNEILIDKIKIIHPFPNPSNPITKINYSITYKSNLSIIVYDLRGRQVEILQNGLQNPGNYTITWDGSSYISGVYFIQMISENFVQTQKLVLIK